MGDVDGGIFSRGVNFCSKEVLMIFTRKFPMNGKAFTIALWAISFSHLAWEKKLKITRMTSLLVTGLNLNPSWLAFSRMLSTSTVSSRGETETPAKWEFSSLGLNPSKTSFGLGINPRCRSSFQISYASSIASLIWISKEALRESSVLPSYGLVIQCLSLSLQLGIHVFFTGMQQK